MKSPGRRPATLIPVVLIGAAVIVGTVGLLRIQTPDAQPPAVPLTAAGSAQLDRAVDRLTQPGLYVAPDVPYARISGTDFDNLKTRLAETAAPLRIAVLPASVTRGGRITPEQLTQLLHRRVAKPGVYAVLVDERGVGSLAARAWGDAAAVAEADAVSAGVKEANGCCPDDYPAAITAFVGEVERENRVFGTFLMWPAVMWPALVALGVGGWVWWRRGRHVPRGADASGQAVAAGPEVIAALVGVLTEELTEVGHRVAALPEESAGNAQLAGRTAHVKYTLAKANALSHRLARPDCSERDVAAVVSLLADTRRDLHVIDELRHGHTAPTPSSPCFIDPRHTPSRAVLAYTPTGLLPRSVPVCAACEADLVAGQRPPVRLLPQSGLDGSPGWANYWESDGGRAYVEGYWGEQSFPDEEFEAARLVPLNTPQPDPVDLLRLRLRTDRE